MANWVSIADATLEPGKPIRAIDARALRDNPIAISEGASGAPKIQTAGITDLNVTTAKLAANAVTTAKITDLNVTTAKLANNAVTTGKLATGEQMTTANVLGATAGAAVGAVGTYAWLSQSTASTSANNIVAGSTYAGSGLRYFGYRGAEDGGSTTSELYGATPSGTWRAMGSSNQGVSTAVKHSLFLRIS